MLKPLSRRLKSSHRSARLAVASLPLVVCALLLATSSAFGAQGLRDETARASRHHARHHAHAAHHRRHRHHRSGRGLAIVRKAATTTSAALLGDETVESNWDNLASGQAEAFPFQARTSGTAGAAHVYIDPGNGATTLLVGIYSNLSGRPGTLLSKGSLAAPKTRAWDTASLTSTQLVSGTTYWLAVLGTGGTLRYRDHAHGSCTALTSAQTNLEAPAATWSSSTAYSTCPVSAYVTAATVTFPVEPPAPVELIPPTTPPSESTTPSEPPPPPPAAPTSSSPPTISGTAEEGQQLRATTGDWTGSPTSYKYQWQDCGASGSRCTNASGVSSSTYELGASDVGYTVRVVVTAFNAGGSTPASSTPTATVAVDPPPPPPAVPTSSSPPTISGTAEEGQQLSATTGTWTGSPTSYAYQWQDCNASGASCATVSGATASTYKLGARDVGHTVRVVVTASNADGSTPASSAPSAAVAADPPPPIAPSNTAVPTVNGTPEAGQTLTAGNGTWTGTAPISYAYQWQDCDSTGCVNVSGGTTTSYKLGASDVGHTIQVVVRASNAAGTTLASSAASAVVSEESSATPTGCFGREEACGYPGPNDAGVESNVTLTRHVGTVIVSEAGTTIKNERIEGKLEIAASNVTVENVEVVATTQKKVCEGTGNIEGSGAIQVQGHGINRSEISTGVVIRHVTVHGVTQGCPESLIEGISMREASSAADVKVEWSKVYWAAHCFQQSATYEYDYCNVSAEIPGAHYDGLFDNGEGTTEATPGLVVKHDTIINPHWQTAALALYNYQKEWGTAEIEDNLLAGGGFIMYPPSNTEHPVIGPIEIAGNRLVRCTGKKAAEILEGHSFCEGIAPAPSKETAAAYKASGELTAFTPEATGFFPNGGSYGPLYPTYDAETDHFSGNFWDNNLEAVL